MSDELVLVTDGESTLHAVGLADGVARWRFATEGASLDADDGVVRALATADGPTPRRAVYRDTAFAGRSVVGRAPAHRRLGDHLVAKGWEAVGADGLRTLLEDGMTGEDRPTRC